MKINNIYVSEDGEKLYSCLLSDSEMKLFSEDDVNNLGAGIAIGGTLGIGSGVRSAISKGNKIINKSEKMIDKRLAENDNLLSRALGVERAGFKDKQAKDFYKNEVLPRIDKKITRNNQEIERISEKTYKMLKKTSFGTMGKHTAIGAGIGAGVAAMRATYLGKKKKHKNKK